MNDYPFMVAEVCPVCDELCIAVVELLIGSPRATGGLMRMSWDEHMTIMTACDHATEAT